MINFTNTYLPVDSVSIVSRQSDLDNTHAFPRHFVRLAAMVTLLLTLACGNVWATPTQTYNLTGYSSAISNGTCTEIGGAYVGRRGSGVTPDATYGVPTGGGNIAVVFSVGQTSTITMIVQNRQTSAKSGTINLAAVSNDYYTACVSGTLGAFPSVGQTCTITYAKNGSQNEEEFSFAASVSAGKYVLWTAGTIASSIYIKRVEINAAGCSGYSFHYGPHTGDWETPICFEQVGSTHEWKITDFTIPSHTNGEFYVGYAGSTNSQSVTRAWTYGYSDGNGAMKLLPTSNSIVGQATGAKGTISIWDDSGWQNQNVGFTPNGYGVTYGGVGHAFNTTATENMWETDVVTLPDVSTTYTMGLATATTGTYVTCAHSSAAEAISNMGVTILEGGKKKILLAPGSFNTAGAVYAVWDGTNSAWGDGTTKLFTDADGDGVWECPVASNCTSINLVRLSSGTTASNIDWSRKWNQTANISVGDLLNKYTITSLSGDNCAYTTTAMHPATGQKGKFRMWANSGDNNWFVHWIPYYVLTYNANGGSGAPSAQSVSSEASPCQLTVSTTEPTRTDYIFEGWSTSSSAVSPDGAWDPGETHAMTGDVTLYAVWTSCSGPTINSFVPTGKTDGTWEVGTTLGSITVTATAGNGGALSYLWYQYDGGNIGAAVAAAGTNNAATYNIPNNAACVERHYYCVVSEAGCSTTRTSDASGALTLTEPVDPCSEPAEVTNEIARFFVPCGTSAAYNVTDQTSSTGDNTYTTTGFNGDRATNATTGFIYGKLAGSDNYIQLKLNTGNNFRAGDVVNAYFSNNNTNNNLKLKSSSGNELGAASASGYDSEYVRTYTLTAADIEDNGSIKFFRKGSDIRVNRIIITREPACFEATITKSSESYTLSTGNGETKDITSDATITSGGTIVIKNNYAGSKEYSFNADGVSISTTSGYIEFTLPSSSILTTGSVIIVTGTSGASDRGLAILDDEGATVASQTNNGAINLSYAVTAGSAINGLNHIRVNRATNNTVKVKSVMVIGCGELSCDPFTVARGGQESGTYMVGSYDGNPLTCTTSVPGFYTYQWKQYTNGDVGTTTNAVGTGAATASFTPNPASAATYYYYCAVTDGCGNTVNTATSGTFTFNAACTSVAAPTGLTCSAQTGTSLTFTWTNAANASGYTATLYSDSGCESEVTHQDLGDVATVTFSTLSSATTYYCKVQSHGDGSTYCAAGGTTAAQSGTTKTLYTITYAKGSAGGASGDNFTDTKTHGVNLTLSSNSSAFTRSGYTYDGWSTNTDGSTKDYNLGGTYTANSAITLYPHWVANATISATLESDEYMRIGAAGMELSLSITGASSGWYYRVKNSDTEGYQTPDTTTYTTTSWTMTSTIGAATNHYVVELYNGSNVKMATSNTITVYGETGHPVTIVAGDNGSVSPSGVVYANGLHLNPTITATPSSGYRFVNWTLSNGNATLADATSASTTITSASGACTVTANFTACSTVTYMYNGAASGASPASETAASVTLPTPTRTGYVLDGWYTTAGTKVGDGGDSYNVVADITLYARWEETCAGALTTLFAWTKGSSTSDVSISGGGSQSLTSSNRGTMSTGTSINAKNSSSGSDKKLEHNAKGYKLGSNEVFIEIQGTSNFAAGDVVTVTGYDNADGANYFTIATTSVGNVNSASTSDTVRTTAIDSNQEEDYSATLKASVTGTYLRIFRIPGSSMYVNAISVTRAGGGGATCYHVYYHGNGAESGYVSDTTSYANSASATILDYNDSRYPLTKAGYTFQGWATSADGAVAKTAGQTVTISSADVHYYAVWAVAAPTYDITNGNPSHGTIAITDGSSAITSAEENATVHISATPADGYSFGSWSVTKDAGGSVDVATSSSTNPTTFTMPAEAVTVTATFSPNTYTVTYNLNGASWASSAGVASYTVGTGATLPVAGDMTNIGYTFGGWYDNSGLTGSAVTEITTSDYGDKEYWAKWTENTYTITYDKNGGTGSTMANTVGHHVTLSTNTYTAPSGKLFLEWNTQADGSGTAYSEGEEVELTANLNLYAIWATEITATWNTTTPNTYYQRGGSGYTVTVYLDQADWDASGNKDDLDLTATEGVTITDVVKSINGSGKAQVTANFAITPDVPEEATKITFTLSVPAAGSYAAVALTHDVTLTSCAGGGALLFSQNFDAATEVPYAANTAVTITTSSGNNIVGNTVASQFTYIACNKKSSSGIAINSETGGNSKDYSGFFGAYYPTTGGKYSLIKNTNFAGSAPTAMKVGMKIWFKQGSSSSDYSVTFAVGDGFSNSNDKPASPNVHSGFSIMNNSTATLTKYATTTNIYSSGISQGSWLDVTWIINNTGSSLSYSDPKSGTSSVDNDKFDVWIGKTRVIAGQAAVTASKTLQNLYIGDPSGKNHEFRLDNVAVYDLNGGGGNTISPTLTWETDLSGGVTKYLGQDADFTHTASTTSNTLGEITYSSSNTGVATVNASGRVHMVGTGTTTITATLAASGCYNGATATYTLTVNEVPCEDVAATIVDGSGNAIPGNAIEKSACTSTTLQVTGYTVGDGAAIEWHKDGVQQGAYNNQTSITITDAGEWSAFTTAGGAGHCKLASVNSIVITNTSSLSVSNIVNSWYVKNGRRTPDIALWQTAAATNFTVKNNANDATITSIGGCEFYKGTDGVIYLMGTKPAGTAPSDMSAGDLVIKVTVSDACNNLTSSTITIHQQAATDRKSIAFVVDGTEKGAFDAENEDHSVNTALFQFLDYTAGGGAFDLTGQNIYSTTDEKAIREHYSQFDAIVITDDPNTKKPSEKTYKTKGYVNAFGTMIDVRPILTMEAYVSALANWSFVKGNPSSPNPRQYEMRLQCKDHEIYSGLPAPSPGTNVWSEVIDGEEYRHVIMVDSTKSPYNKHAYNDSTSQYPALQGFSSEAMDDLLGLGVISGGALHAGIERQAEPAARMMLLGLNAKALPNALTAEGKKVIENAITYLLKTNMEDVDDCSNYFIGGTSGKEKDWGTLSNWTKTGALPNYETRVRILAPCEVTGITAKVAQVDIATSGTSKNKVGTCNGSLTIKPDGALVVGGKVRVAEAPYFNNSDLKPTGVADLTINTDEDNQACLILDNSDASTKATVNLYSLGRKISDSNQFQYMAVPMNYVDVNPAFAGEGIYTYVWHEGSGWERRGYYTELYAFEGVGITTNATTASNYTMKGALASTKAQAIPITAENKKLNLIGNSWTAPIQISELEASDFGDATVESTVYIYSTGHDAPEGPQSGSTETAGQWLAIPFNAVGFGAWEGLKVIPSMQAFQIKASSAGTLTLDYSKHVRGGSTDLNAQLRAPQRKAENEDVQLMRIRVADSKTHTDLYLFEGEQFTDAFDDGWEANYRVGDNQSAKLYARTSIGVMAVAAMPSLESTPVYFIPGQETEYTFTFGGSGMGYYLNDLKLEKSTLISEGAEYTFTYERGDAAARFMISATPYGAPEIITGNEEIRSENKARKILYNNKLYIIVNGHVYSAEGALVK